MKLFTKSCDCGGIIFGPRVDGKARGAWLGFDKCQECRNTERNKIATALARDKVAGMRGDA